MECKEFKKYISEYIDEALPKDQMDAMKQHLAYCVACKREYEELAKLRALLQGIEEVPLPADFDEKMKAALEPEFAAARAKNASSAGSDSADDMTRKLVVLPPGKSHKRLMKRLTAVAAVLVIGLFGVAVAQNENIILQGFDNAVPQDDISQESASAGSLEESATNDENTVSDTELIESETDDTEIAYDSSDLAAYAAEDSANTGAEDFEGGNVEGSAESGVLSESGAVSAGDGAGGTEVYAQAERSTDSTVAQSNDDSDKALLESGGAASGAAMTSGAGDKSSGKHGHKGHKKPVSASRGGDDFHKSGANSAADVEYYKGLIANELSGSNYEITGYSQIDQEKWIFVVSVQEDEAEKSLIYKGENGRLTLVDED